jgi:hypothetical protein
MRTMLAGLVMAECPVRRLMLRSILALYLTLLSVSAAYGETWVCTYADDQKPQTSTTKFVVNGNDLIQEDKHYQILENNEIGLIAVHGFSRLDTPTNPVLVVLAVLIEKQTGQFKWRGVLNTGNISSNHGHCIKN